MSKFIWQQISDFQALCSLLVIVCSDIAYTAHVWCVGACICYKNVQHLWCVGAVMCDISYVNSVHVINQNPRVTAINSCIEVDLTGQVCADSIGTRMYSGASVCLSVTLWLVCIMFTCISAFLAMISIGPTLCFIRKSDLFELSYMLQYAGNVTLLMPK